MTEPRTETGKRLPTGRLVDLHPDDILAIEAEAIAIGEQRERERLGVEWERVKQAINAVTIGGGGQMSANDIAKSVDRLLADPDPSA